MHVTLAFDAQCRAVGLPEPVAEFKFHPVRKWRTDWAWPDRKLAVEVEGGVFIHGRHSRGAGMLKDMEKYNALAAAGWRLIRVTPSQVRSGAALAAVEAALKGEVTA
jgi:very-short-patch-repair endonuclease